eukprot:scaffold8249_cov175-Ochromonas_danica.AAC.1
MAYISRLALLKETIRQSPDAIIISERSLYTDKMVFAKMLHEADCALHRVIYVRTDPEICHQRIAKRSRSGEEGIPLPYLKECHKYHESMLNKELDDCVCREQLIVDGDKDIYENQENLEKMLSSVVSYIQAL